MSDISRPTPLSSRLDQPRDRVVKTLQSAVERDLMTLEEFEERLELAERATSQEGLDVLVEDIPQAPPGGGAGLPALAPETRPIRVLFGSAKREGRWRAPEVLNARAVFGEITLDFKQAELPANGAVLNCFSLFGTINVKVPDTMSVECEGTGIFGEFKSKNVEGAGDGPRLVIRGKSVFGSVKVKAPREREKGWRGKHH